MQPKAANMFTEPTDVPRLGKYVPTLFIGLGGTGKDVLMRLRRRLYDTGGATARPYLRYLMIDTDTDQWWPTYEPQADYEPVRPGPGETVDCQIKDDDLTRVFQLLEQEHDPLYMGWLEPGLHRFRSAICQGTGTMRPLGRIAFMLRHQAIRDHIERHLTAMLHDVATLDARELRNVMIETDTVEVVIVTSLAGGAGAGMFLDMAYLVRDLFTTHDMLKNLTTKYTTLIATLPTVHKSMMPEGIFQKLQQNAYAALLELEHYGTVHPGDDTFLGNCRTLKGGRSAVGFVAPWKQNQFIEGQGWDACFLIDNVNRSNQHDALTAHETFQMIADYLFLDLQTPEFAIRKRSTRSNMLQYQLDCSVTYIQSEAVKAELGDTVLSGADDDIVYAIRSGCAFSSFGLAEISFSRERVYQAAGYLLAARLVKDWWLRDAGSRQPGEYQEDAEDQLGKLSDRLQKRFRDFSTQNDSDRCQILSPKWTEQNCNDQITRALIACSDVGPGASDNTFNSERLEEHVFNQLQEENPQGFRRVGSLTVLLDEWFERRRTGEDAIKTFAEILANACSRFLLQRVGLDLSEFHNGCVTELLMRSCPGSERRVRLENLIRFSSPFLPLSFPTSGDPRATPHFSNLLGSKCPDPNQVPGADERQRVLMEEITQLAQDENANLGRPDALPADESSLLICREVWGIPLKSYAYLSSLHAAYMERVREGTAGECHINCHETWEDLPDILQITADRRERIEQNVLHVIFGMLIGTICCKQEEGRFSYSLQVPGPEELPIRLGSRIGRMIMNACENEQICQYLRKAPNDWETDAASSPKQWALVYASAVQTLASTHCDFTDQYSTSISPLRNCMTALLKNFERQLRATEEGQRWLKYLRFPTEDTNDLKDAWDALYHDLVHKWGILSCEWPQVPIYQANFGRADQLQLPK